MLDRYSTQSLRGKPFWQRSSSKCRQPRKPSKHPKKFKHNLNSITSGPQSFRAAKKAFLIITTPSIRLLLKLSTPPFNSPSTRVLGSCGSEALTQTGFRTFRMCSSSRPSGFRASQLIIEGHRLTFNNIFKPFSNNNSNNRRSPRGPPDIPRPPRSRRPCRKRQMQLSSARIRMNLGSV